MKEPMLSIESLSTPNTSEETVIYSLNIATNKRFCLKYMENVLINLLFPLQRPDT